MQKALIACSIIFLTACGGGGGDSSQPAPPPPPPEPTAQQLAESSLLLQRATFGPSYDDIYNAAQNGLDNWLDTQFSMPSSLHQPIVEQYVEQYGYDLGGYPPPSFYRRFAFWEQALTAPDQLRQMVAYALTQIFVVSDNVGMLNNNPIALSNYYDMLLNNAFSNFRDLLMAVTLHPAMGIYLSHVNNGKSDPVANTFPDENYAREVMQLFSIGLFELNADGS